MRIPFKYKFTIYHTKKYTLKLTFKKKFSTNENFISLGCACHPAHMLAIMGLRKQSLPFDWLLTDSIKGMDYVCDNIKNNFVNYTADLKSDKNNHTFASHYPHSLFFHHSAIINNKELLQVINDRVPRFLNELKNNSCTFVYSVTSTSLVNKSAVTFLVDSIREFVSLIKSQDKLLVYINHDESILENKEYGDDLINQLSCIPNVSCAKFLLEAKKYGLWGYENNYFQLLKNLGANINHRLPVLKFIKEPL